VGQSEFNETEPEFEMITHEFLLQKCWWKEPSRESRYQTVTLTEKDPGKIASDKSFEK